MVTAMLDIDTGKIHYIDSDTYLIKIELNLGDVGSQNLAELNELTDTIHINQKLYRGKKFRNLVKAEMVRVLTPILGSEIDFNGETESLASLIEVV